MLLFYLQINIVNVYNMDIFKYLINNLLLFFSESANQLITQKWPHCVRRMVRLFLLLDLNRIKCSTEKNGSKSISCVQLARDIEVVKKKRFVSANAESINVLMWCWNLLLTAFRQRNRSKSKMCDSHGLLFSFAN